MLASERTESPEADVKDSLGSTDVALAILIQGVHCTQAKCHSAEETKCLGSAEGSILTARSSVAIELHLRFRNPLAIQSPPIAESFVTELPGSTGHASSYHWHLQIDVGQVKRIADTPHCNTYHLTIAVDANHRRCT